MEFWEEMNWYAVQSKPYQESLAAVAVAGLDLEVFQPRIRRERIVCGVERLVSAPLFVGYFFARFRPLLSFDTVRYARGVLRVVGTSRCPIPLENAIIDCIRERVQADGFIHLAPEPFLVGDKVRIEQGPFAGWMGRVEREWDDGRRVGILLETIQQTHLVVQKRCLTRIAESE